MSRPGFQTAESHSTVVLTVLPYSSSGNVLPHDLDLDATFCRV